jgi:hypothetical protein
MSELHWHKADDYHIRSRCGRFSVSRLNVSPRVWYVAWRRPFSELDPPTELGATSLPDTANDAERISAIREMQGLCEASI